METRKKRTLNQIALSASRSLRKKIANLALYESIRDRQMDCLETLRMAAILTILETDDPSEREGAENVLDEIGFRGSRRTLRIGRSLSDGAKETLASLAMIGHVIVGGSRRLLETTALMTALRPEKGDQRGAAISILEQLGTSSLTWTFRTLMKIGFLSLNDLDDFVELQLELATLKAGPAAQPQQTVPASPEKAEEPHEAPTTGEPAVSAEEPVEVPIEEEVVDEERTFGLNDEETLAYVQMLIEEEGIETSQELKAVDEEAHSACDARDLWSRLKFKENSCVQEAPPRRPLPAGLNASGLRDAELRGAEISELQMYKLICVEVFRLATAKPLMGMAYAPIQAVKSNMSRRLNGDKDNVNLFEKCWQRMVSSGAINLRKSSETASLNPHTSDITDPEVKAAVAWALSEHRKVNGR